MNKILAKLGPNMNKEWLKTNLQGPTILQLGFYWIILVTLALFIINYPANLPGWRFFGTLICLTCLLILNLVWVKPDPNALQNKRSVHEWTFLIVSAALILATAWLSGQSDVIYLMTMVCAQASFKRGVWPAGLIFGVAYLLVWLGYQIAVKSTINAIIAVESASATGVISVLLLMTLLNRYMRQTRRAEALLTELQAANAALEAVREKEKDLAIAEERVRLARDIHDGLGHHLTVLSIQLQAADKLMERNPQAAAEAIQVCRVETQAALEEVRRSVSVMRQPPVENQPLAESLSHLVQGFRQHAALPASFTCSGAPTDLSPSTRETIYRTAQEGLTNVQKHAVNVKQVSIRLDYEQKVARLCVVDDGQGTAAETDANPAGFGLKGLRERAEALGGTFRSGPRQTGGYEIELCLPSEGSKL
jgi:signal transduction histidine kinase